MEVCRKSAHHSCNCFSNNLKDLKFDDFLEKDHIGIGSDTWICISVLEQEHDTKPFFDAVKNFYISTLKR